MALFTPLPELFAPVDLEQLRKNLNISTQGRQRGEKDFPPSESKTPDDVELSIRGKFGDALQRYLDDYEREIQAYRSRLADISYAFTDFSTVSRFKDSVGDMNAEINTVKNRLFDKKGHLESMAGEVSKFRKAHGLMDRMPVESHDLKNYFVLALLATIEIVLTWFLLRDAGSPFTVFFHSIVFIVLNIVISYAFFGKVAKWCHHKTSSFKKFAGIVIWPAWFVYALCLNLIFAHYRSIASEAGKNLATASIAELTDYLNIGGKAIENFLASPFGVGDLWGAALAIIGFFLALSAIAKGYLHNDVYPGYGDKKKRYDESNSSYLHATEKAVNMFKMQRNNGSKIAEEELDKIDQDRRRVPTIMADAPALKGRFENAFNRLNTDYQTLVGEYRSANIIARNSTSPAYFDEFEGLPFPNISEFDDREPKDPDAIVRQLSEYRDQIHRIFDDAIQQVETMESVMKSEYPFSVSKGS